MTEQMIMDFFIEKGKGKGLEHDTDLFAGGFINSLFAFEMVVYIEDVFSVKIDDKEITEDNFRSIDSITAMINRVKGG